MRTQKTRGGKYAQPELRKLRGVVNMRTQVLAKKKAPRRALVFRVRFSRVRGAVVSAELMGQSL